MIREVITTAKTVDLALEKGAEELGFSLAEVKYEVLEKKKKEAQKKRNKNRFIF